MELITIILVAVILILILGAVLTLFCRKKKQNVDEIDIEKEDREPCTKIYMNPNDIDNLTSEEVEVVDENAACEKDSDLSFNKITCKSLQSRNLPIYEEMSIDGFDNNAFRIDVIDLKNWNAGSSTYYYHYTSLQCARQILRDRRLIASVPKIKNFGKGVFFTTLEPDTSEHQLITNNYIYYSKKYLRNIQCAFAISGNDFFLKKLKANLNRDVWKCKNDIDLTRISFKVIIRNPSYRHQLNIIN